MSDLTNSAATREFGFVPRRVVLSLPPLVGQALAESADANQRSRKGELLRLVIDQLKAERRLPREYLP